MNFKKYIDLPYKNLGRDKDGLDCFGLVRKIFLDVRNITLPDYTELKYDKEWYNKEEDHIINNIDEHWFKVDPPFKVFDCFIFLDVGCNSKIANHIGMYIGDGKFIHILENSKSRVDRLEGYFSRKLYEARRYKEM